MTTKAVNAETVLELLRQLPPRERLHVVSLALPELERDLPAMPMSFDFWQSVDARVLAERQGVKPVESLDAVRGGWPEDESVDDFVSAMREWRRQDLVEASSHE